MITLDMIQKKDSPVNYVDRIVSIFFGSIVSILLAKRRFCSKVFPDSAKTSRKNRRICCLDSQRNAFTSKSRPNGHLEFHFLGG